MIGLAGVLRGAVLAATLSAGACASYEPLPLPARPRLASRASELRGMPSRPVALADLDRLVVANSPDLRVARGRLGIDSSQVLSAGILPNPVVALSYPFLVAGPGTTNAYSLGLAQDLKSIVLRGSKLDVARATSSNVSATLLWQEWQTIARARLLYVDIVSGERALRYIAQDRRLLQQRFDLTKSAIAQGNATLATLSPDLVAVGDIKKTEDDLQRLQLTRRQQLNILLGLSPGATLRLADVPTVPTLDVRLVRAELATIADRRPDLIALQYGYRAQDAKVRQAILAQFPNLSVGVVGGSDTSGIIAFGPQLTVELPIFDRNQGAIAFERATREQLHSDFDARVATAVGDVQSLLVQQALLSRQLAELAPRIEEAKDIAQRTATAFKQGVFDERAYVDIAVARLSREQEKVGLQQALLEGQVGLATLLGAGFPSVHVDPEPPSYDPIGLFRRAAR